MLNNTMHIVSESGAKAKEFSERKTALLQKGTLHVYKNALYFVRILLLQRALLFFFVLHFCLLFICSTVLQGDLYTI